MLVELALQEYGYRSIMDDMGAEHIGSIRKYVGTGLEPRILNFCGFVGLHWLRF